jgi:RNA polymerase sigma-70 factor, ECF subfamily
MPVIRNETEDRRPLVRTMGPLLRLLSETALLEQARARNGGAFEELVTRSEVRLYRVAIRIVRNDSDAQEIMQEAYLSAWKRLPEFEGRCQFSSWMHMVVVNTSLMHLRSRKRHPEVGIDEIDRAEFDDVIAVVEPRPEGPEEKLQYKELLHAVDATVNALPDKLKEISLLRLMGEVSNEDAAAALGLSKQAAKTRLHRARKVLRQALIEYVAC